MDRKANREMWMKHIHSQKSSGLSRKKWCNANDVNFNTLAYWIGRFKKEAIAPETDVINWAKVIPKSDDINKITDQLTVTIGKAVINFSSSTCLESFEKVVQVLVKYV